MKSKHTPCFPFFGLLLTGILLTACVAQDAKPDRRKRVTVYTDCVTGADSLLFKQFTKFEHIQVIIRVLDRDSILGRIQREGYDSYADLILLHGADQLNKASKMGLWRHLDGIKLDESIQKSFRSPKHLWITLSKTPLVLIYDDRILSKNTVTSYGQLLLPTWKGKVALQQMDNSTFQVFRQTMRLLQKEKTAAFLNDLYKQSALPKQGDDLLQIKRVQSGQAQLAIVELASLVRASEEKDSTHRNAYRHIQPVFPNQQRGTFLNVTGAGIFRYARNTQHAQLLLEFLAGKNAQYEFAASRYEYPVLEDMQADYRLTQFGTFRSRFYLNRNVSFKSRKTRR
jgi:iron(III) transport system substrate-binding protein